MGGRHQNEGLEETKNTTKMEKMKKGGQAYIIYLNTTSKERKIVCSPNEGWVQFFNPKKKKDERKMRRLGSSSKFSLNNFRVVSGLGQRYKIK